MLDSLASALGDEDSCMTNWSFGSGGLWARVGSFFDLLSSNQVWTLLIIGI